MKLYNALILPHILNVACSHPSVMDLRRKIIPLAKGRVLEVGMGSGINLPLYNPDQVELVWGLEPALAMRKKAEPYLRKSPVPVQWLDLPAEEIFLEDNCADTVVLTFTLCTIPDWHAALQQMRRVLKPGGQLLFCEHGLAPDIKVQKWQARLTPLWKPIAGGCHLNRPILQFIEQSGLMIDYIESHYADGVPGFAGYMTYGRAIKSK